MSAFDWQAAAWENPNLSDSLPLLPFDLSDALLPGETKQVHLYEARFLHLFTRAETRSHNCVGQLLVTPSGNAAATTSLLEIEESRRLDVGVWARLRCVGRVKLKAMHPSGFDYLVGSCELVTDEPMSADVAHMYFDGDTESAKDALRECQEAHASCVELEQRMGARVGARGDSGSGPIDERVEWGHERSTEKRFEKSLTALRDERRETLCSRGLDLPPADGLDKSLQKLWGVDSEEAAETQLWSFAAAAALAPEMRARALGLTSTVERLKDAATSFRNRERRLAAEVALMEATSAIDND